MMESAIKNGVEVLTDFEVASAEYTENIHNIKSLDGKTIKARATINAAGLYADAVSEIFGGEKFKITPRKGEYHLLDKMTKGRPERVLFPVPSKVSKGMLVIPTVEGTVLIGPTADDIDDKEDKDTTSKQLKAILESAKNLVPAISDRDTIANFAGLRPALEHGDFFIDISKKAPYFIQVAGIQSPGLTAAPAIAEYVKDLVKKLGMQLTEKSNYDPYIERVTRMEDLSPEEADEQIKKNSSVWQHYLQM